MRRESASVVGGWEVVEVTAGAEGVDIVAGVGGLVGRGGMVLFELVLAEEKKLNPILMTEKNRVAFSCSNHVNLY